MTIVLAQPFAVHYGQFYLYDTEHENAEWETLSASVVGVVGVELGCAIFLTSRHTGEVNLTVVYADAEPAPDESYDDILEIDLESSTPSLIVATWHCDEFELPALPAGPGNYRMRYHGRGADAADPPPMDIDEVVDNYLLQIWPAPPAAARVVKATSRWLSYWLMPASEQRR